MRFVGYGNSSKCKAEFITDATLSARACVCVWVREGEWLLRCCKHCVNLHAYWLLSNYAEMQRRIEKQSLMCDPTGSTDGSSVIAPQQMKRCPFFFSPLFPKFLTLSLWVQRSLKLSKGCTLALTHTHMQTLYMWKPKWKPVCCDWLSFLSVKLQLLSDQKPVTKQKKCLFIYKEMIPK